MARRLAACYWYHVSKNHPFADGNKRAGYMMAKAFLLKNAYTLAMPEEKAFRASMLVAESKMTKRGLLLAMGRYVKQNYTL